MTENYREKKGLTPFLAFVGVFTGEDVQDTHSENTNKGKKK